MLFQKAILKPEVPHVIRHYFDATWELWRREINRTLWDWAVDGPFCKDSACSQRLKPTDRKQIWECVRCGARTSLPRHDLISLRDRAIRLFEEEYRQVSRT